MKGKLPKAERSGIGQMLFSYAISDPSGKNIFQKSRRYIPSCSGAGIFPLELPNCPW